MKAQRFNPALTLLLALILMIPATTTFAADEPAPGNAAGTIATIWVIWPKDGQTAQFEAALKQHAAWRKNAGESFTWSIYQPVVGSDLAHYVIRSGDHTWKDMDIEDGWETKAGASAEYDRQVGPYTARAEHYFAETDLKNSHWIDSNDYKYFGVSTYYTKPGMSADRMAAMDKINQAIVSAKWPYPFEVSSTIGGRGQLVIVDPMKSYADMADPTPSLMEVLAKSLGSKDAAAATFRQFGSTIDHSDYTVYAYRPDLSTPK
ncbi:MAG: hypothetical protein WBW61_13120 [Rhodanobacteraceae bacterium]